MRSGTRGTGHERRTGSGSFESRVPNPESRLWLLLAVPLVLLAFSCREQGRPDPQVQMAPSHETSRSPEEQPGRAQATARLEIPPEVEKTYQGVVIHWKETGGQEGNIEVPLGGGAKIPGSDLEVKSDAYLPAFSMAADRITSTGTAEANPAARVIITEKGKDLFAGWIFKRFPDVHPFKHPRYSIRLEGGVRRRS